MISTRAPKFRDITGQRFGRLVAVWRESKPVKGSSSTLSIWVCSCDCGREHRSALHSLLRGTKSCGCLTREITVAHSTKHGHSPAGNESKTYKTWASMFHRCTNPRATGFAYYGGAGISVCDRWKDFRNFLADMGEKPEGLTIDRISNVRGYEPGNCRWATSSEQNRNRRPRGTVLIPGKVNSADIRRLRAMAAAGHTEREIAEIFHISPSYTHELICGKYPRRHAEQVEIDAATVQAERMGMTHDQFAEAIRGTEQVR